MEVNDTAWTIIQIIMVLIITSPMWIFGLASIGVLFGG